MRARWGVLVLVLVCQPARADDKLATAREHYRAATAAYEVGQFDEAIKEFSEAYKLKTDPTILFNLAQAYRLAGRKQDALRQYRMYLVKVPNAPNRAEVEQRIAELETPQSEDPDTELARRAFERGTAQYEARRYAEAIVEFESAKKLKPTAALDFNIARSYDRMGQVEQALAAYRRYIQSVPTPADAAEVKARIEVLEKRLAPVAPVPTPPTTAPASRAQVSRTAPAAAPSHQRKPWVVPVAAVVAVVVVGVAVGLGVGLGVGKSQVDPTASFGAVHWK